MTRDRPLFLIFLRCHRGFDTTPNFFLKTSATNAARMIQGVVVGSPVGDPEKFLIKYDEDQSVEAVDLLRPVAKRPWWSLVLSN